MHSLRVVKGAPAGGSLGSNSAQEIFNHLMTNKKDSRTIATQLGHIQMIIAEEANSVLTHNKIPSSWWEKKNPQANSV